MNSHPPAMRPGFTLIELMIVVAIIGVLSAIAIPKFAELLVKSQEGATKGNLGRLRSALSIYYSDMEGYFPNANSNSNTTNSTVLSATLIPKYLDRIPQVKIRNHPPTTAVYQHSLTQNHNHDSGRGDWGYDGRLPRTSTWGSVWVWCTHTDTKGTQWSEY